MKYCPECGKENKDSNKFCLKCGAPFEEEAKAEELCCPNCGVTIEEADDFCPECGTPLKGELEYEEEESAPQTGKNYVQTSYHWGPGEIFLGVLGVGGVIGLIWLFTIIG
ncbi:MAG: zinc-ribbon domain-containing protein [Huintestinicola sp.]|uniref:zinc-ribbon domain-containing protein n=1 Tax=Huintestinicola sp. TaxID=2981661 RepID=UPI003F037588